MTRTPTDHSDFPIMQNPHSQIHGALQSWGILCCHKLYEFHWLFELQSWSSRKFGNEGNESLSEGKNETERKMTTRTYLSYLRICERTGFSIRLGCFCGLGLCCGPQKCTGQSRGYQCLSKHGFQETVANNKNNILESCKWVICFQF